ncbi:hypothetical protein [Xanthomarina sp.]|uniref:hypothetical protein n=1 Tax=Xanthomarina sp. TaxID=1931211 RepID=UPI002C825BE6|nr:hypothetical protein [Xanthomarina sp.]HLV39658.1 hypothetical protein [Xanthomarina sp.]
MNDFLIAYYSFITKGVILFSAIIGFVLFKKYKNTSTKYFIFFLGYVVVLELFAYYPTLFLKVEFLDPLKVIIDKTVFKQNLWVYTLFWDIGSIMFYSFFYYKILNKKNNKLLVKYVSTFFLISSILCIIINWNEFFVALFPFITIMGTLVIIFYIVLFFIESLMSNESLTFFKSVNFYISAILLIWWLITGPVVFFENYVSEADWNFIFLRWQIYLSANIFMYLGFAFALIFCKPESE